MAKAGPPACNIAKKKKKKKIAINFSESEIDVALQLIQLSGDSSDDRNGVVQGTTEQSDCGTTHAVSFNHNFFQQQEDEANISLIIRKNIRFRSVSDIYKVTKPLSIVN
ncbi:hypothetical protein FNV43_RR22054 [Rhamnella rubrinervis]|uniref:Uncharacterized protein n=1 Tax=Rhamnella rubrinervis TaxID=2594499 RepID=A0A8K0GMT0_9ROSA|nr:hypothetical protein FNV43_RR22054 [Rhamnella rubrinervis]